MSPEILKIVVTLGVPGLALYVMYLLLRTFGFKFEAIGRTWSALIAVLFLLTVGFVTYTALTRNVVASDALTDEDKRAIFVRQTASSAGESGGRKLVELTFDLQVDTSKTNKPKGQIFSHVEKVEYGFDKRWFKPPVKVETSPVNNFAHSITVWGATAVRVAVHLNNPRDVIIFDGRMKTDGPTEFRQ